MSLYMHALRIAMLCSPLEAPFLLLPGVYPAITLRIGQVYSVSVTMLCVSVGNNSLALWKASFIVSILVLAPIAGACFEIAAVLAAFMALPHAYAGVDRLGGHSSV